MHSRLLNIIKYKTGGKQTEFAALLGWTVQSLAKELEKEYWGSPSDNERLSRITLSIKSVIEFLSKGGDVYPASKATKELLDKFPNFRGKALPENNINFLKPSAKEIDNNNLKGDLDGKQNPLK
jgi:hypothetical protein